MMMLHFDCISYCTIQQTDQATFLSPTMQSAKVARQVKASHGSCIHTDRQTDMQTEQQRRTDDAHPHLQLLELRGPRDARGPSKTKKSEIRHDTYG